MEDEVVPSNGPADDRRAAIEAAFAAAEAKANEAEAAPEPEQVAESEPEPTEQVPVEAQAEAEVEADAAPEVEAEPVVQEPKVAKEPKAPQSWKPAQREKFAALDPELKEEIMRRERQIDETLKSTANERKFAQEIQTVFQPYEAELRAAGVNTKDTVKDLLNTAYVLRRGDQQSKARLVAQIIQAHGVDLSTLDSLLAGATPTHADPTAQRLEQVERELQASRQAAQHQEMQTHQRAVDEFASKNEFFNDVAHLMQPMLERGIAPDLKTAYEMACRAHPEVSKVLSQRKNNTASTATKLAASSSVRGNGPRNTAAPKGGPKDMRSILEAQWDAQTQTGKRY